MRIIIVDDSRLARVELKQQLANIRGVDIVGEAANVEDAVEMLVTVDTDLLLLDIDLPDGTGFDVLEQSQQVPYVIFVTAFNEYAIKSFEYNALDYLLKPVRQSRLETALEKVSTLLAQTQTENKKLSPEQRIFIKDRHKCFFVSLENVVAFEALGNYTQVHLESGSPSIYRPISAVYERLDQDIFFRASRSLVINTNYIDSIEAEENSTLTVALKTGKRVTISKRQAAEFKRLWSL